MIRVIPFLLSLLLFIFGSDSALARNPFEIDEIEIEGVALFESQDIERVINLSTGEIVDSKKIAYAKKALQDLYFSKGYDEVKIETRFSRRLAPDGKSNIHSIEFNVDEGNPTLVGKFEFEITGKLDPATARQVRAELDKLKLSTGAPLKRDVLDNKIRAVQDAISSMDYLGVRVEKTETEVRKSKDQPTLKDILIRIELGDRISFGFRGNVFFTYSQLNGFVNEQKSLGISKDYITRIETRILQEYKSYGFAFATIQTFTFESPEKETRHVSFEIHEGERVRINEVKFDGNLRFTNEELKKVFYERSSQLVQNYFYIEKDVEKSSLLVMEWMQSRGHLTSKLVSINRTFDEKKNYVDLLIYIYESERTDLRTLSTPGVTALTTAEIQKVLGVEVGQPLNLFVFSEGVERLKSWYFGHGFLDFRYEDFSESEVVQYTEENRYADIKLNVHEGTRYKIDKIVIEGLKKTKPYVVERELRLKPGDYFDEEKRADSEARIRKLGLFSSLTILPMDTSAAESSDDYKTLKITVEESSPGVAEAGVGIRNDLGGRLFGSISYGNLWGRNHSISLTANSNRRFPGLGGSFCANDAQKAADSSKDYCFIEYNIQLAYQYPWALLGKTTYKPSMSFEKTQFKKFDAQTLALTNSLQRQLWEYPNLTVGLTHSLEQIDQFNANLAVDNQKLQVGALIPALIIDRRDSIMLPTRGYYSTWTYEFAHPDLLSQRGEFPVTYSRFQTRNDLFIPLPFFSTLFMSFRTGIERNYSKPPPGREGDTRYAIPLVKQFTLGGISSVRGFREQTIVIPNNKAVTGYASYVNYRTQLDFPFAGQIRLGPFLDAANLLVDDYSLRVGMRIGYGVGIRYQSPVGMINFDVGINPRPTPTEDNYVLHFSIGTL